MSNREKRIITVLFLILILSGLLAVRGYGINVDENTEINIARMDLKEYVRLLLGEGSRLFRYMDGMIGDLMDSVEIDHGEAILYPAAALVSILRAVGRADLGMMAYHMYLYICFLFGLLAAYQTGKFLTEKISFGIMAAAFIGLNPLLFGMSFINNKDMVMLSLTSICIFTGIQFVEKKTRVWSVVWAVSVAFCANMRIVGFAYGGLFGLLYLYEFLKSEEKDRKVFINGLLAIGVLCLTFFVITPATWYSIPEYFRYTLTSSAGFLRWHGWELYCGEVSSMALFFCVFRHYNAGGFSRSISCRSGGMFLSACCKIKKKLGQAEIYADLYDHFVGTDAVFCIQGSECIL